MRPTKRRMMRISKTSPKPPDRKKPHPLEYGQVGSAPSSKMMTMMKSMNRMVASWGPRGSQRAFANLCSARLRHRRTCATPQKKRPGKPGRSGGIQDAGRQDGLIRLLRHRAALRTVADIAGENRGAGRAQLRAALVEARTDALCVRARRRAQTHGVRRASIGLFLGVSESSGRRRENEPEGECRYDTHDVRPI